MYWTWWIIRVDKHCHKYYPYLAIVFLKWIFYQVWYLEYFSEFIGSSFVWLLFSCHELASQGCPTKLYRYHGINVELLLYSSFQTLSCSYTLIFENWVALVFILKYCHSELLMYSSTRTSSVSCTQILSPRVAPVLRYCYVKLLLVIGYWNAELLLYLDTRTQRCSCTGVLECQVTCVLKY